MQEYRRRHSALPAYSFHSILAAALLFVLGFVFSACATEPPPEEPVESASAPPPTLQHIETEHRMHSFTSAVLRLRFSVSQPGEHPLTLRGYRYRMESGDEQIASGTRSWDARTALDARTVPGGGSTQFEISAELPLPTEPASGSGTSKTELPYRLFLTLEAASSDADSPLRLDAEVSGSIPAPQLPRLSIPRVRIPQFETKIIRIEYKLQIHNPNSFPVQLLPGEYTFTVAEIPWDRDRLPQELIIPAGEAKQVSMPMTINYLKAGRDTVNILMGAKTLDYRLTGEARVLPAKSQQRSDQGQEQEVEPGKAYRFSFDTSGTSAIIRP